MVHSDLLFAGYGGNISTVAQEVVMYSHQGAWMELYLQV